METIEKPNNDRFIILKKTMINDANLYLKYVPPPPDQTIKNTKINKTNNKLKANLPKSTKYIIIL